MPGYTSDEVQASVDKFLLGSMSVPRTGLGSRDVLSARNDIYALLTTTLLLRPDSYFYLISLARNRLEALRRQQVLALADMLEASTVTSLNRRGAPVSSTVDLSNAQAALLNLNAGVNQGQGTQTRDLGPEVARFRNSVDRFVRTQLQGNVVSSGVPTETAGELRESIREAWVQVRVRHAQMLALSSAIQDALTDLSSVRLPERAVQEVITRLRTRITELIQQLEDDKSVSTHRGAMLELLTMRTLLTRVSSFRIPKKLLAPLPGDGTTLTGVGGTVAGAITGTVSGPFNIGPVSSLDFESGSPVVVSSIGFLRYSNAETRSRSFTSLTFPASAELRLTVDGVAYPADASFGGVTYASVVAFVLALQNYITVNAVPATAFLEGSRAVIQSDAFTDSSSVEIGVGNAAQGAFLVTSGFTQTATCRPVTVAELRTEASAFPAVRISEVRQDYAVADAFTLAGGVLDLAKVSGTVVVGGGSFLTAPVNLEHLGVRAGDYLWAGGEVAQILAVSGADVTLDTELSVLGSVSYRIGADFRQVPVGARVLTSSAQVPMNNGFFRVTSSSVAQLTLDRLFATSGDRVSANVFTSYLRASAPGTEPADGITAWPASAGATAVGLVPSVTQARSSFTSLSVGTPIDLLSRGVSVGDRASVLSSVPTTTVVAAVGVNELSVEPTPYIAGSVEYRVESGRYLAWEDLVADVSAFVDSVDFEEADFAITRIVSGASSTVLLGAGGAVATYYAQLTALGDIQEYAVPFERTVDNILRMLTEQGMDRAADLLTSLQVVEFFGMHPDGASYSTHLIRTAADVTRAVAPVSRYARSILGSPEVQIRGRARVPG